MKTLIIYDSQISEIKFFIVDGDFSKYHGIYINSGTSPLEWECGEWLFDDETGEDKHEMSSDVNIIEAKQWDKIAIITFLN